MDNNIKANLRKIKNKELDNKHLIMDNDTQANGEMINIMELGN